MGTKIHMLLTRITLVCVVFLAFIVPVSAKGVNPAEKFADAYTLVAVVNSLRVANGLPEYSIHPTLMAVAQAHAEYMASTGTISHTGAGGTSYPQRLANAGYVTTFRSENIIGGRNMTEQEAVIAWQGDAPHLHTMLSPSLCEAGAGVAVSGDRVYYVLDTGCSSGRSSSVTPIPGSSPVPPGSPGSSGVVTVVPNTPESDGSLVHFVQPGEAVWSIAIAYGTTIDEIRRLNNLSANPVIFPGNRLVIREAFTPTPVTPSPTATLIPTSTPVPTSTRIPTQTVTPTPTRAAPVSATTSAAIAGGIILLTIVAAALFTSLSARKDLRGDV